MVVASAAGGSIRRSTLATVKSATLAAPARFRARAQAAAVDPVVITSSTSRMRFPRTRSGRRQRKAAVTLRRRMVLLRPACVAVARARPRAPSTGMPVRRDEPAGQQLRLVESAGPAAPPVQRHRHDDVEALVARQGVRQQVGQRMRQRANALVLEQVDQLPQRAVISPERIGRVKTTKAVAA